MRKLFQGVVDFHTRVRPAVKDTFARLALGQAPDVLFIACSDSRVAANVFASTEPGDLFVVRNVGNMVPPCSVDGHSTADESEAAAIEFALLNLAVRHVIVCGHSECGAMQAICNGGNAGLLCVNLNSWLRHGKQALTRFEHGEGGALLPEAKHNKVSQLNVLQQIEHLRSYPIVKARLEAGTLRLHGWWFDIFGAEVSAYDPAAERFVVINAESEAQLFAKLGE
jgi:carbonic anhydrase